MTSITPKTTIEKPGAVLSPGRLSLIAWGILLAASLLPNILVKELAGIDTSWMLMVKVVLLAAGVGLTFFVAVLRPLRNFMLILIAIFLFEFAVSLLEVTQIWTGWFGSGNAPFTTDMLGIQFGRLIVSLLVIGAMFALGYRRQQFFLARGDLSAPITPVPVLGFPKPESVEALRQHVGGLHQPGHTRFSRHRRAT